MNTLSKNLKVAVTMVSAIFFMSACGQSNQTAVKKMETKSESEKTMAGSGTIDTITLGAGCFWCVEAVFQRLNGVLTVESGYMGGSVKNPSYREVCTGSTGHAEVARITYDKTKVTLDEILEVFWKTHDPTTLNYQGNDHGTQYRSAVFYYSEDQKTIAEKYKKEINASGAYPNPIVTEISPAKEFYKAEDYHQNYYNQNGQEGYCRYVIQPKVEKFEKIFKNKLKK